MSTLYLFTFTPTQHRTQLNTAQHSTTQHRYGVAPVKLNRLTDSKQYKINKILLSLYHFILPIFGHKKTLQNNNNNY